jgi:predicted nucleic acid-binding protein
VIVLDAAALVDVVVDQPPKELVLGHLDQPIVAPAHQLAEVLSALARLVRAGSLTSDAASAALDEAAALEQELVTPAPAHLRRALELQATIRALDGLYVALAEERRCPLLTTDGRLARAKPPCEVILASAVAG